MKVKMSDLFGFVNDLEKIIYGLGFKILLKGDNNDRALFRVNAGAAAIANGGNKEISDMSCSVTSIDPSNDNRIFVQKGLNKKNNHEFSFMEERNFIRMYPMLLTSYLTLAWKVVWKALNK